MKRLDFGRYALGCCAAAATLVGCSGSQAQVGAPPVSVRAVNFGVSSGASSESVLYSFTGGNDGGDAATSLVFDRQENLYGTTVVGGTFACGTVFRLSPQGSPPWHETVLDNFDCHANGKNPYGGVTLDGKGDLDGTTVAGGSGGTCSDGCGIIFQVRPAVEKVLHSFTSGTDGFGPGGGLVLDPAGHLYGTTPDGGAHSEGVIYEVSRAQHGRWHERVIHAFTGGKDGGTGSLGVLLLQSGSLFGVTETGGPYGAGTVFKLSPTSKKRWKLTTLYAFKGMPDAGSPYGGLVANASGQLYGTTYYGGTKGLGSVFELTPNGKGRYRERVLYSFQGGNDGSSSTSTLAFGAAGELYGTTSAGGGTCDCGTIFKINASSGKEKVLHRFGNGTDGAYPYYGLTQGADSNFYGTTVAGGSFNQGTVFEFTP